MKACHNVHMHVPTLPRLNREDNVYDKLPSTATVAEHVCSPESLNDTCLGRFSDQGDYRVFGSDICVTSVTSRCNNIVLILCQRRRRLANKKTTLVQPLLFTLEWDKCIPRDHVYWLNPWSIDILLYKPRKQTFFFKFEIIINVLVTYFYFIWISIYVMGVRSLYSVINISLF